MMELRTPGSEHGGRWVVRGSGWLGSSPVWWLVGCGPQIWWFWVGGKQQEATMRGGDDWDGGGFADRPATGWSWVRRRTARLTEGAGLLLATNLGRGSGTIMVWVVAFPGDVRPAWLRVVVLGLVGEHGVRWPGYGENDNLVDVLGSDGSLVGSTAICWDIMQGDHLSYWTPFFSATI